jgi:hypothetical protein
LDGFDEEFRDADLETTVVFLILHKSVNLTKMGEEGCWYIDEFTELGVLKDFCEHLCRPPSTLQKSRIALSKFPKLNQLPKMAWTYMFK